VVDEGDSHAPAEHSAQRFRRLKDHSLSKTPTTLAVEFSGSAARAEPSKIAGEMEASAVSDVFIDSILLRPAVAGDPRLNHTINMKPDHRHQLRFGSYATPRFRYDSTVTDACRGDVVIVAISNGRIPWPLGRVRGNSNRALIVYGVLARAVRREASQAVAFWWGITAQTVTKWRKALGVVEQTEGDRAVRAEHGKRNWAKVGPKFLAKAQDPERRKKIAAARTGKARPKSVVDALKKVNTGRPLGATHRARQSAAHKKRGTRPPWLNPPWIAEEDSLITTLTPAEVAKKTGRTLQAVYVRRSILKGMKLNGAE
jgi:hypothetical protein